MNYAGAYRSTERRLPNLTPNAWLRFDSIRRAVESVAPASIIEIGAGDGALGEWFARRFSYTAIEPDPESFSICASRLAPIAGAQVLNVDDSQVGPRRADLVCASEVLEHVDDDTAAIRRWARLVEPGGGLLVSVPRGPDRFNAWDERVGHLRRYRRSDLAAVLEIAGLEVEFIDSYGVVVGDLLERVRALLARRLDADVSASERTGRSGRLLRLPASMRLATAAIAVPGRVVQVPFRQREVGTGLVALARVRS